MRWLALALLAACGSSSRSSRPTDPPPDEHWETVTDHRYTYDGCATGPFELELPARADEWGRRVVILVYGPRDLQLDYTEDGLAPRYQSMGKLFVGTRGSHERCQVGAGDVATVAAPAPRPSSPPIDRRKHVQREDTVIPDAPLPRLVEYTGELEHPQYPRQQHGTKWMPKGDPFIYADEYRSITWDNAHGLGGFKLRMWSVKPQDFTGVVIRVLDQRLVPDLPIAAYATKFTARVAEAKRRRDAYQPEAIAKYDAWVATCKATPTADECADFGRAVRVPPPPRAETKPPAPSGDVDWIAGYWSFDDALGDFVWIAGTYVVRAPKPAVAAAPPPQPAPEPEPTPEPTPEPVRELEPRVDAPPPPRVEVIPPPPPLVGAVWVAGHWRLAGVQWQWVPGTWRAAPRDHVYRAPAVRARAGIRVYVPGGWIRIGR